MTRGRHRPRRLWLTLTAAMALGALAGPNLSAARPPTGEPAIRATCTVTDEFPLSTSPDTIPVMVTYMTNSRRTRDDVEPTLPKDRLVNGFAREGEFNSIWGPKGIELALVGFRTCSYTLGPTFDPDPKYPRATVPKPDASLDTVFLKLLRDHNTRTVKDGSGTVPFRGLDLYLWWDIADYPGYAVRPRYGRDDEAPGSDNEPVGGRPGAVWMDKECVGSYDSCAALLAHEVGHFLGLCHCCHKETENPQCINGLRPGYCPGLGVSAPRRVSCATSAMGKRLMSATNPHTDPAHRGLLECEVQEAQEGARKVLKFGANGIEKKSEPKRRTYKGR